MYAKLLIFMNKSYFSTKKPAYYYYYYYLIKELR